MIVGYARVSSVGQDNGGQMERLKATGVEKVFSEKQSGLDRERKALDRCLGFVRDGDVLIVTKLDRLARSAAHLHQIVEAFNEKGVGFRVLDDPSLDTTTRTGKLVFGILASIAEFETALAKERQLEGIAKAKAEGRTGGRPALITEEVKATIVRLKGEANSVRKIAAEVGFSKSAVQKVLIAGCRTQKPGHNVLPEGRTGRAATRSNRPLSANKQTLSCSVVRTDLGRRQTVRFWDELARKVPFRWRIRTVTLPILGFQLGLAFFGLAVQAEVKSRKTKALRPRRLFTVRRS